MKFLVTGSTGFVGKNLIKRLRGELYLYSRGEDLEHVLSKFQPDYIFHLAGEIYKTEEMYASNVQLTHDLLELTKDIPYTSFIYVGSSSEYGRKDHPMSEKDYLNPTNMYEATKGAASLLCLGYARTYSKPIQVARPFSLYGPEEPDHRFIPTVIRTAKRWGHLKLAPGVHDYIHVDDFIDCLLSMADFPVQGRVLNIGTGIQTTNHELVELVERITQKKVNITEIPKLHDYDSDSWVCDPTEMNKVYIPEISLLEGLTKLCHS